VNTETSSSSTGGQAKSAEGGPDSSIVGGVHTSTASSISRADGDYHRAGRRILPPET
jgi:hypothetical protein